MARKPASKPALHLQQVPAQRNPAPARAMVDAAPVALLLIERSGTILSCNRAACELLAALSKRPRGRNLWDLLGYSSYPPEKLPVDRHGVLVLRGLRVAEQVVDLQAALTGAAAGQYVVSLISAAERLQVEQSLDEMRERLRQVVDGVQEGLLVVDLEQQLVVDANQLGLEILARERHQVVGHQCRSLLCRQCRASCRSLAVGALEQVEELLLTPSGAEVPVLRSTRRFRFRNRDYLLVCLNDISSHKQAEQKITRLAYYDSLTALPNRNLLNDRLQQALARGRRQRDKVAVVQLDLDHFKDINNSLGHPAGDRLLELIGQRLSAAVRQTDTVARSGGDEFVLILGSIQSTRQAAVAVRKVLGQLSRPFVLDERQLFVSGSMGIALFPEDGQTAEQLLREADIALSRAKQAGRNNYRFFREDMNCEADEKLRLANDLHRVIELEQLRIVYQPQLDLRTDRIVGVEALLRWEHPQLGMISPVQFIPIAEENGTIVSIGEWVLRQASRQVRLWQRLGHPGLRLAVNISASQFRLNDLDQVIGRVLRQSGFKPSLLELEITESMLMDDVEQARRQLQRIKQQGVRLAIDDFGTGFSSLSYLKDFPVDRLKIDRSFIQEVETSRENAAIVQAVIALARNLGQAVTAEGVETEAQLKFLRRHSCDEAQGFYYWPPQEAEALARLLA